jgi:nucleoside-diphosphate-sugar epimerase
MNVLVTGCAGFIGSHVTEALLADGHDVTGIDCFTPYYGMDAKLRNLAGFRNRICFYDMDVRTADLRTLLSYSDAVLHIAGQPGVRACWGADFTEYAQHNVLATQRLLDAMTKANWRGRLVFTSTSSVYGKVARIPIHESDPCEPLSPYGITKLAAEQLVKCYVQYMGLDAVVLRLFSVYGPRQRPDMAVARFIEAMRAGQEVTIYGNGMQLREMTYVGDVAGAILAAMTAKHIPRGAVYNIGGGNVTNVLDLAETVADALGMELKAKHEPEQPGEMASNIAATDRAHKVLDWWPKTQLKTGIRKQVDWDAQNRASH